APRRGAARVGPRRGGAHGRDRGAARRRRPAQPRGTEVLRPPVPARSGTGLARARRVGAAGAPAGGGGGGGGRGGTRGRGGPRPGSRATAPTSSASRYRSTPTTRTRSKWHGPGTCSAGWSGGRTGGARRGRR